MAPEQNGSAIHFHLPECLRAPSSALRAKDSIPLFLHEGQVAIAHCPITRKNGRKTSINDKEGLR